MSEEQKDPQDPQDPQAERAEKEREAKRRSSLVRQSTSLQPYRTPEELAEMVGRMKFMIPGGDKLNDKQIWGLCQAALIYGLDPLMKEIFWIDGPSPGIRGLRRKGRKQLVETFEASGLPSLDFVLLTDAGERAAMEIPDKALAYKCVGMIPAKRSAHADDAKKYADAGAPWEDIKNLIGDAPITVGYGYLTVEQMYNKDFPEWWHLCTNEEKNTENRKIWIDGKQKWAKCFVLRDRKCPECDEESWKEPSSYSHVQHAQKRAEAHFWKLECDLPFDIGPAGEGFADHGVYDDSVIDTTAVELGDERPIFMGKEVPEHIKTSEEFEAWVTLISEENERQEEESDKTPEQREVEGKQASEGIYGTGDGIPSRPNKDEPKAPPKPTVRVPRPAVQVQAAFVERIGAKGYKGLRRNASLEKVVGTHLSTVFNSDDDARHACQMYLTGKPTLTDFSGAELKALLDMLEIHPQNGGHAPSVAAAQEMKNCALSLQAEGA